MSPIRLHRFFFLLLLSGPGFLLTACSGSNATAPTPTAAVSTRANPTEPALAPPVPGAYAALGASETYGVGAEPHTRGYAYLVAHALGATRFVDEGIPGTTLNAAYQTELTNALAIRPSLATVFFGYNDLAAGASRDGFLQDLHDLAISLHRGRVRVLIVGMPDLSLLPAIRRHPIPHLEATIVSWNRGMALVARQTGSRYLDLQSFGAEQAAHPNYISPDGLHPSNAGHARLAHVIVSLIKKDRLWNR